MHAFRIAFPVLIAVLICLLQTGPVAAQADAEIDALNRQAAELYQSKKYGEAMRPAQQALELAEQRFGPNHKHVGTLAGNLGLLQWQQNHHKEAEQLFFRAVTILEKAQDADPAEVAKMLHNLIYVYNVQQRYTDAEPLYRRMLAVKEKSAGPDHPDVAAVLEQFAIFYGAQRRHAEAVPVLERGLAIMEKARGPEHIDLQPWLDRLAQYHASQFESAKAEPLYLRELAIVEKARGADHPDVANVLRELASIYESLSFQQFDKAEQMYKRGIAILETAKGPDHIELQPWLNDLATVNKRQYRYADAELHYQRALAIVEKAKGTDHLDVVAALNKLASVYTAYGQKQEAKAEPLYLRAIGILEKAKGASHPDLIDAFTDLALTYEALQRYADAETFYLRALTTAENAHGPDHPDLAKTLDYIVRFYMFRRQYAKAEPLQRRALAIMEKAHGSDHPNVVLTINNLAHLYDMMHRYADTAALYERALVIREKEKNPSFRQLSSAVENLGDAYQSLGRFEEAERLFKRGLEMVEREYGPEHSEVNIALGKLIKLYKLQVRQADAEPLMRRVLAAAEKKTDSATNKLGLHNARSDLGHLLQSRGKLTEAEALFRQALAQDEQWGGPTDWLVFTDLINLGGVLNDANQLAEAEVFLRRATDFAERAGDNSMQADAFNSLAILLAASGRLGEAEVYYRRALPHIESFKSPFQISSVLNNFASLLEQTGRPEEAEPLQRRALAIREKQHGPDHPEILFVLNNLAVLLEHTKRYEEAEQLLRRSLAIAERAFGPDHPRVATRLANLAGLLTHTGRRAEAEPLHRRALLINEKSYGLDHPKVATTLNGLAELLMVTGRRDEAEQLLRRALTIDEKSYGPAHTDTARDFFNLAILRSAGGDWAEAANLHARALPGSHNGSAGAEGVNREDIAKALSRSNSATLRQYARALYRSNAASASVREESFEQAQTALKTEAGDALAQMSARFAKGQGPLMELVRERQNLVVRRKNEDKRLLAATGQGEVSAADALRKSIAGIDNSLASIDATLADKFPDYSDLTNPKPLAVAEVQALLTHKEALILFLDVKRIGPLPGETLVWVITKQTIAQRSISFDTDALAERVLALRCGLDQTLWQDAASAQKCRTALGAPAGIGSDSNQPPQVLPFDLQRAHALFQALLGPDEKLIQDKHLFIVPSGPLTSLSFNVLVTKAPKSTSLVPPDGYGEAAWLGIRQPISILPSVASLKALRRLARTSQATKAYLGVGNPLLDGEQDDPRFGLFHLKRAQAARDKQQCPDTRVTRIALKAGRPVTEFNRLFRGTHADIEQIRLATPLPETADELCAVGQRLGVPESEILLGDRARETALKDLSANGQLGRYRVLHFATHGVLAGEVQNVAEPGLILTPPAKGTQELKALEQDDGFLTASEIASLRLDTDWVVLSACNTASGASEKAEALSGLARAFFYAGARSLLVSHWAVNSDATVKLVTRAFEALAQDRHITHAEALQRSMLALVKTGGRAAHPSYWAPFVVVGSDGLVAAPEEETASIPLPTRKPPLKTGAREGTPSNTAQAARPRKRKTPSSTNPGSDWERKVFNQ